jgi:hypothetical protein
MATQANVAHVLAFFGCLKNDMCKYLLELRARGAGSLQNLYLQHRKTDTGNIHGPRAIRTHNLNFREVELNI